MVKHSNTISICQSQICVICCHFSGILAFGVKESAIVNKIFTAVNMVVLVFVIIAGFIKGDLGNWQITQEDILNYTINAYVAL